MKIDKGEVVAGRFVVPYRVYGESPRLMVCVSGAQQTMVVWRSLVNHFMRDYSVVTFDMPGLGRTRTLTGPLETTFEEQYLILRAIVAATDRGGPLTLVGCSWGTLVVSAYASRLPAAVDTLVLGSFGVKPSAEMRDVIREGRRLYESGAREAGGHLIIERFGQNISPMYKKRIVAQFERMDEDQARAFVNHCRFVDSVSHIDELIDLNAITARTLIINGANDTILDLEDVDIAANRIANCQSRIVEDAGHFLHFERPDIINIYAEFLEQRSCA